MNPEACEVCGSTNVKEIRCKLICQNCGTILRSCADLLFDMEKSTVTERYRPGAVGEPVGGCGRFLTIFC